MVNVVATNWHKEHQSCLQLPFRFMTHQHWVIPAVCRPLVHPWNPTNHHTLYPRYCWSTPPPVPPALCHLPPASHQYRCRLDKKHKSVHHQQPSGHNSSIHSSEGLTGSTVHFISATNTVFKAVTHTRFWDAPHKWIYPPTGAENISASTNSICMYTTENQVSILLIHNMLYGSFGLTPKTNSNTD